MVAETATRRGCFAGDGFLASTDRGLSIGSIFLYVGVAQQTVSQDEADLNFNCETGLDLSERLLILSIETLSFAGKWSHQRRPNYSGSSTILYREKIDRVRISTKPARPTFF